jgi:hypothetical protein
MATMDAIFDLSDVVPTTATLGATTSSAEINLGAGTVNAFVATADSHIRVGVTGMGASSASYFRIPANTVFILTLNRNTGFIRVYNPSAGNSTYHIVPLVRG